MILSHNQIEEIAAVVTKDFNKFFFGEESENPKRFVRATPIDQFTSEYLGLDVSYERLSYDDSICGLTAYADTEYEIEKCGIKRIIPLRQNQILLDESFARPNQVKKLCSKRRFTLAHECAHQILYQYESDEGKVACRKKYAARSSFSLRDLKTHEDWNEWQANALGAAILMPQSEMDRAMWYFSHDEPLVSYGGRFDRNDRMTLSMICEQLGVSRSAAVIRLRKLGFINERPSFEFHEPWQVIV